MKNKKGFTLVELLAVIAILAILVIIALPNVMGMFNTAKSKSFVTEAQAIYKQVSTDFVTDNLGKSGGQEYCQYTEIDGLTVNNPKDPSATGATCKTMQLTTTRNYYVKVNSAGKIEKFVVFDGSYAYANDDFEDGKATDISESTVVPTDKIKSIDMTAATIEQ